MPATPSNAALRVAALAYAARGLAVFPLVPGTKVPRTARGHLDASTDASVIECWWQEWPASGIGVACKTSRLLVVDVDQHEGGPDGAGSLASLERQHGRLPGTWRVVTGGGGLHLYFRVPGDAVRVPGTLGPGVDIKFNGYVVLPPSRHPDGGVYQWEIGSGLDDVPLAVVPDWILTFKPKRTSTGNGAILLHSRNVELTSIAGSWRRHGMSADEMFTRLQAENAARCAPPLDAEEVRKIADSVARYDPAEPEVQVTSSSQMSGSATSSSPWDRAVTATELVGTEIQDPVWIALDLIAPGSVTVVASPRGLGKTHAAHALAVAVATAGEFRGRRLGGGRVLLVDRDNSRREVRRRIAGWGAVGIEQLKVLCRDEAPPLTDAKAWASFPVADYDVVVLDSLSATTEGVEERDGGGTGKALAPLLDLARRGPAVLVLANTRKDGEVIRGAVVIGDRADIVYEVRDATDLVLDPKKGVWWECLPAAGDAAWSSRPKRRRRRDDYRLAFIPSKFRIGEEPDPFVLEITLTDPWTLCEVTEEIEAAHDEAKGEAEVERQRKIETAVATLDIRIRAAFEAGHPLTKTQAEGVLGEAGISRSVARTQFQEQLGKRWILEAGESHGGRPPQVVVPPRRAGNPGEKKLDAADPSANKAFGVPDLSPPSRDKAGSKLDAEKPANGTALRDDRLLCAATPATREGMVADVVVAYGAPDREPGTEG